MVLPLAHLGHWYLFAPYAVPIVLVIWSIATTTRRQRRRDREEEEKNQ